MDNKVLTIVIVSYNTKEILLRCLFSLEQENRRTGEQEREWEIVIVDNGSTDGSVGEIKNLKLKIKNLELIENKENFGFAKAVNQGIAQAIGDVILLLNSDIIIKKGSLSEMVKFIEENDGVGVVGAKLLNLDMSPQPSVFRLPTVAGAFREFWFGQDGQFSKYLPEGKGAMEVEGIVGAAMLIPRKTIESVGVLDEKYFMYFEDLDYCRRVRRAGLKVFYLPEAEFIHAHGASGKSIPGLTRKWLAESSRRYHGWAKYYLLTCVIWLGQRWRKLLKK